MALAFAATLPSLSNAQTKIYIDPGHGGSDPGAVNSTFGTQEAARVLYTGLELRNYLNADSANTSGGGNWTTRMSRTTNVSVSLSARSVDSNNWGSARFLSIHQNAFNKSANGTETFSFSNGTTAANLRDRVQEEAIIAWGLVNRGSKTANFAVIRDTSAPAILTEMGFIDAPADHPKCSSNVECSKYALGMLYGIQRHYGLAKFNPGGSGGGPNLPPTTGIVVDNTSSAYTETGSWANSASSGFYNTESRFATASSTNNRATWAPNLTQSGQYQVYVWYVAGSNRSTGAAYKINHLAGQSTVVRNQTSNGSQWVLLGTYNFNSGTAGTVQLDGPTSLNGGLSTTVVSADAARFLRIGDLPSTEVVVDNTDPGFTAPSANWFPSSSVAGYLGTNYHARATQLISDAASWSATLPASGSYEVFARWTTGTNRATSAPFIVVHSGGSTTVARNQRNNNGTWVSLGTFNFNAGTATRVRLSCFTSSGDYVIADGIKLVQQ